MKREGLLTCFTEDGGSGQGNRIKLVLSDAAGYNLNQGVIWAGRDLAESSVIVPGRKERG